MSKPLHVLVVDDSAVVRQGISMILGGDRSIRVSTASHPIIAMDKMRRERPDVVLLDLEMPHMDGLTFLRRVMIEDPVPVVVCSALAGDFAEAAVLALEAGAVDIVTKPRLGVGAFIQESAERFRDVVRAAAVARLRPRVRRPGGAAGGRTETPLAAAPALRVTTEKVVAVGASTGGTEALRSILEALPPDAPGLVIVQHMPEGFTRAFARRLNETCRIEVKEAEDGDRVARGRALIAPGNRHIRVRRTGASYRVEVGEGPLVNRHRPSVDVLFESVAQAAGANAVAVLLTGMGADGARAMLEMKRAGASTIAQDELTSVVFGMPKEAIAIGAVDEIAGLPQIPALLLRLAGSPG